MPVLPASTLPSQIITRVEDHYSDCKLACYLLQCFIEAAFKSARESMRKLDVSELRQEHELLTRINELLRLIEEEGEAQYQISILLKVRRL